MSSIENQDIINIEYHGYKKNISRPYNFQTFKEIIQQIFYLTIPQINKAKIKYLDKGEDGQFLDVENEKDYQETFECENKPINFFVELDNNFLVSRNEFIDKYFNEDINEEINKLNCNKILDKKKSEIKKHYIDKFKIKIKDQCLDYINSLIFEWKKYKSNYIEEELIKINYCFMKDLDIKKKLIEGFYNQILEELKDEIKNRIETYKKEVTSIIINYNKNLENSVVIKK